MIGRRRGSWVSWRWICKYAAGWVQDDLLFRYLDYLVALLL